MPTVLAGQQYATTTDLTNAGLPAAAMATLTTPQLTAALANASAEVDSYLATRFELPLASWGLDIVQATLRIAVFDLMLKRGYQPGTDSENVFKLQYDMAIKWLTNVAMGKATPAFPTTKTATSFNTQQQPFSLQPVGGGISLGNTDDTQALGIGTLQTPKTRGW